MQPPAGHAVIRIEPEWSFKQTLFKDRPNSSVKSLLENGSNSRRKERMSLKFRVWNSRAHTLRPSFGSTCASRHTFDWSAEGHYACRPKPYLMEGERFLSMQISNGYKPFLSAAWILFNVIVFVGIQWIAFIEKDRPPWSIRPFFRGFFVLISYQLDIVWSIWSLKV